MQLMTASSSKGISICPWGLDRFRSSLTFMAATCRAAPPAHTHFWGPYLAARGYAGFTVSYRLTKPGQKTYPGVVHDIRAAVQFVRGRAKEFRLDPGRVALWGNSAGAHLASLVALAGDGPLFAGGYPNDAHAKESSSVKVLIGTYGIYDLLMQC